MGRRVRPYFYYCVNNCLIETEMGLDLDGFGTGNAKNSLNTGGELDPAARRYAYQFSRFKPLAAHVGYRHGHLNHRRGGDFTPGFERHRAYSASMT